MTKKKKNETAEKKKKKTRTPATPSGVIALETVCVKHRANNRQARKKISSSSPMTAQRENVGNLAWRLIEEGIWMSNAQACHYRTYAAYHRAGIARRRNIPLLRMFLPAVSKKGVISPLYLTTLPHTYPLFLRAFCARAHLHRYAHSAEEMMRVALEDGVISGHCRAMKKATV